MLHPLKITSTLADETRFQIYEHMLKHKQTFTVQSIAQQFHIHPNVARLHLTKLADIGVISAEFEKTGKGGRPGRIYRASDQGVSLSFPKREDTLLLRILLPMIEQLGSGALDKGVSIAYSIGQQDMMAHIQQHKQPLSIDSKCDILTKQSALIGYIPTITEQEQQYTIHFSIYNCPFHSQLQAHEALVCRLHESYLKGLIDTLFDTNEFTQTEHMLQSCKNCHYTINLPK